MASNCKYYDSPGKPSQVFNAAYQHYSNFYSDVNEAEKKAASFWLLTKAPGSIIGPDSDFRTAGLEPGVTSDVTLNAMGRGFEVKASNGETKYLSGLDIANELSGSKIEMFDIAESKDELNFIVDDLVQKGAKIDFVSARSGKYYIRSSADPSNRYFNNSRFTFQTEIPIFAFAVMPEGKRAANGVFTTHKHGSENFRKNLKAILKNPTTPFLSEFSSRILMAASSFPSLEFLQKEDFNNRFHNDKDKSSVIVYDTLDNAVYVNGDIEMNEEAFQSLMIREALYAGFSKLVSQEGAAKNLWNSIYNDTKNAFENKGYSSKYLESPLTFLDGILRNAKFREKVSSIKMDDSPQSANQYDRAAAALLNQYGIRKSSRAYFDTLLNGAETADNKSRTVISSGYAMSGFIGTDSAVLAGLEDDTLTEATADVKKPDLTTAKVEGAASKSNDKWSKNYTNSEVINKYIDAHIEKIRSLFFQNSKKTEKGRVVKEAARFRFILKELQEMSTPLVLLDIGNRELRILERRLEVGYKNLDEVGENIKLLDAWANLTQNMNDAFESKELNQAYKTKEFDTAVGSIVANATRLKDLHMRELINLFKERAAEEHVDPSIIGEINLSHAVEDIGYFASQFLGLSTGSDPFEIVSNFLIRRSATLANKDWASFEAESDKMFRSVNNDIDWMFEQDKDGNLQMRTMIDKEVYNKLRDIAKSISTYEKERAPLRKEISQYRLELMELNYKKQQLGNTDAFDVEINKLLAKIEDLNKQVAAHEKKTATWDAYWDTMREYFVLDNMKVEIPADANDPRAGTIVELEYSKMTPQEKEWALAPWNEYKEELKKDYIYYTVDGKLKENNRKYEEQVASENPENFINWINSKGSALPVARPRFASKWFAFKPKDNWKNSEFYDRLSETQRTFYDWFTEQFVTAHSDIDQGEAYFGEYERDKILREFVFMKEENATKLKYLNKDLRNWASNIIFTSIPTATETTKLRLPLSSQERDVLKLRSFKQTITKDQGYYKKGDALPLEFEKGIGEGKYLWNDNDVLVDKGNNYVKRIVPKMYDPIQMFKEFKKISINYKYKKEVEDILTTAKELVNIAEISGVKKYGRSSTKRTRNLMAERLAATIDAYLYDKRADAITSKGLEPGDRALSGAQIIDSINKFTRVRQLGLNPASGVTNLVMGTINNYMYAARDSYFNENDLHWAYWMLKQSIASYYTAGGISNKWKNSDAHKIMLLLKQFNVIGGLMEENFVDADAVNKLFNYLFTFQKGGEYLNQGAVLLAMMRRQKVNVNGTEVSLWDAYKVNEDGVLEMQHPDAEWVNKANTATDITEKEVLFAGAISEVIKEIHGDYDPLNFKLANRKLFTRVLMTFRTWMPMAIETRLGKRRKNAPLSLFEGKLVENEGRWFTFGRALFGSRQEDIALAQRSWRGIKNGSRFMMGVLASTIKRSWGTKIVGNMGLVNDFERQNLAVMMKEVWWLMMITATGVMAKRMVVRTQDEEDEDSEKFFTWFFNQTTRIENDLWFYYSPQDFAKVVRDPVAMWSTLNQALKVINAGVGYIKDSDKDIYKTGFRKGKSKLATQLKLFLPIIRQGETMWGMIENVYSPVVVR